jgi:hypothetical protein
MSVYLPRNLLRTKADDGVAPFQEGAYADVVVKLGLIKLIQKRFNICDELCVSSLLLRRL